MYRHFPENVRLWRGFVLLSVEHNIRVHAMLCVGKLKNSHMLQTTKNVFSFFICHKHIFCSCGPLPPYYDSIIAIHLSLCQLHCPSCMYTGFSIYGLCQKFSKFFVCDFCTVISIGWMLKEFLVLDAFAYFGFLFSFQKLQILHGPTEFLCQTKHQRRVF